MDGSPLSLSLPVGSYPASSLFPHDASKTKDYPIHKVIVSLCRSVALIALYCVYAFLASEYVAALSRTQVFLPPLSASCQPAALPSARRSAAPSITFSPSRLKCLSAFRLLIRLHSRVSWVNQRGRPSSEKRFVSQAPDDRPPRYYRQIFTRRVAGGRPLLSLSLSPSAFLRLTYSRSDGRRIFIIRIPPHGAGRTNERVEQNR